MKAKFIYEAIKHLTPRSNKEIKKFFEEKFNMSYEKFQEYLKELESLGVKIINKYTWMNSESLAALRVIEVKSYEVYESQQNIAKCLTKKDANKIMKAHSQYVYPEGELEITEGYMYLDVMELKTVIEKLKKTQPE